MVMFENLMAFMFTLYINKDIYLSMCNNFLGERLTLQKIRVCVRLDAQVQ